MTPRLRLALLIACAAVLPGGCASTAFAPSPPPPPQVETRPPCPGERFMWIGGHWKYNGHEYVWVSGRWRERGAWVAGHWVHRPGGWVWVPGHYK